MNKLTTNMYDKYFVFTVAALLIIGLVMITSASTSISERLYHQPFHFFYNQSAHIFLGILFLLIIMRINIKFWHKISKLMLLTGLILLIAVLIPGIGHQVNGSMRWVGAGPIRLQVSEFIKLAFVIYLASYLTRRNHEICTKPAEFLKPMIILGIISILLLKEPNFGTAVVITITTMSMLYLSGVRWWQFVGLLLLAAIAVSILAISSPYRMARLTAFLNPWAHQFNSGYQLTQSLIAFGRGGIFGAGLGSSIQKLFYLPEAHTDFLFAVLAEELGLIGILIVIALYTLMVIRILMIGRRAQLAGMHAEGYMAYGFAIWIGTQAIVNMGVNSGLLPTKGLTLPLMSYGGSSLLVTFIVIAILLRIDYEARKKDVFRERFRKSLY
ncbi:MAG: putative lipid II flippase FtsW [Gammaproteobacteria bacterium]